MVTAHPSTVATLHKKSSSPATNATTEDVDFSRKFGEGAVAFHVSVPYGYIIEI